MGHGHRRGLRLCCALEVDELVPGGACVGRRHGDCGGTGRSRGSAIRSIRGSSHGLLLVWHLVRSHGLWHGHLHRGLLCSRGECCGDGGGVLHLEQCHLVGNFMGVGGKGHF